MMPDKDQLPCVIDTRWHTFADDGSCPSLLATDYKEPKAVCDPCPTLDASYPGKQNNQDMTKLVCYENHGQDSRIRETGEVAPSIPAQAGTGGNNLPLVQTVEGEPDAEKFVCYESHGLAARFKPTGVSPTILAQRGTRGNNLALVQKVYAFDSLASNSMRSSNPKSGCREIDVAKTLDTSDPSPSKNQGGMAIVEEAVAIAENVIGRKVENGGNGVGAKEGVCYTLDTVGVHGVCYPIDMTNVDGREKHPMGKAYDEPGTAAYSLTRRRPSGVCLPGVVRRLVPVECERLMGFPDGWTLIPWRGKSKEHCPDGPRYKALGNSMCTNVMAWIGERIAAAAKEIEDGR